MTSGSEDQSSKWLPKFSRRFSLPSMSRRQLQPEDRATSIFTVLTSIHSNRKATPASLNSRHTQFEGEDCFDQTWRIDTVFRSHRDKLEGQHAEQLKLKGTATPASASTKLSFGVFRVCDEHNTVKVCGFKLNFDKNSGSSLAKPRTRTDFAAVSDRAQSPRLCFPVQPHARGIASNVPSSPSRLCP